MKNMCTSFKLLLTVFSNLALLLYSSIAIDSAAANNGVKIMERPILNLLSLRKIERVEIDSSSEELNDVETSKEQLLFKSNEIFSDFQVPESGKLGKENVLLKLLCTSVHFPVHFKYFGQGAPIGLPENERVSSFPSEIYPLDDQDINEALQNNSNVSTFKSTFIFEALEKNTGNYSCCHFDHNNNDDCASLYLSIPGTKSKLKIQFCFSKGSRKFLLNSHTSFHNTDFGIYSSFKQKVSSGSHKTRLSQDFNFFETLESTSSTSAYHLTVEGGEEKKLVQFPCATSWSTANVSLFLYDNSASSSSSLKTLLRSDFNPKFGFRIALNLLTGKNGGNTTNFADNLYTCSFEQDGQVEQLYFKIQYQSGHRLKVKHNAENSEFSCQSSHATELSYGLIPCHSVMSCQFTLIRLRNSVQVPMKRVAAGEEVKWRYSSDSLHCNTTKLERLRYCQRPLSLGIFYCSIPPASSTEIDGVFDHIFYFNPDKRAQVSVFSSMDDWRAIDYVKKNITFLHITRTMPVPSEKLQFGLNITFHCIGKAILVSPSIIWLVQSSENLTLYQSDREWTDFQSGHIHGEFTLETLSFSSPSDLNSVYCAAPVVNSPTDWASSQYNLDFEYSDEEYSEEEIEGNSVGIGRAIGGLIGFNILVILLYIILGLLLLRKYSRIGPISLIVCMQFLLVLALFLLALCFPSKKEIDYIEE